MVFVSEFDHDTATRVLSPLVKTRLAFCAGVVDAAVGHRGSEAGARILSASLDCGKRIYTAMESWLEGLGPLGPLAIPTRNGKPRPIGVMTDGPYLIVGTYRGGDEVATVSELSRSEWDNPSGIWMPLELSEPQTASTWAWQWSLHRVRESIAKVLARRALRIDYAPFAHEAAWRTALVLMGHGSLYQQPVPLDRIDARLASMPANVTTFVSTGVANQSDFIALRVYCEHLRSVGRSELAPPWPGPDVSPLGSWVWSGYSPNRLLSRVTQVYLSALRGYDAIVRGWFPAFAHYLKTAALLPCKIVGELVPQTSDAPSGAPIFSWHLEPLASGQPIDVSIDVTNNLSQVSYERIREVNNQSRLLRPDAVIRLSLEWHTEHLQIFGATPVHDLAYVWLWDDLKEIACVDR